MSFNFNSVSPKAIIGKNLSTGSFCVIQDNVQIGDNVIIGNNVTIKSGSIIGDNVRIYEGVVIGSEPQDVKYDFKVTPKTFISENTVLREYVTVNSNTIHDGITFIGKNCFIMAYSHISHDNFVGDNVILANSVQIGGHSVINKDSFIGGGTTIHQRSKIGEYSMIGASSKINKDVLPYTLVDGNPAVYKTINLIGLKRKNFLNEEIKNIKEIYSIIYHSNKNVTQALDLISKMGTKESKVVLDFIKNSKRGVIKKYEAIT